MDVTPATWAVAVVGLLLIGLLGGLQLIAVIRPRDAWTVTNVYGGSPEQTDATAYFAFNQGYAWADAALWAPVQIAGCIGMLLGQRWGFLLALAASVPFVYSAVPLFIWDRDLGFRKPGWIITWGMWPVFGAVQFSYCMVTLL